MIKEGRYHNIKRKMMKIKKVMFTIYLKKMMKIKKSKFKTDWILEKDDDIE